MRRFLSYLARWCILVAVCLVPTATQANLDWRLRTIETEHFIVHYDTGHEAIADRAAMIAERAYTRVTGVLGHRPAIKTHIILRDTTDQANGSANAIPYPRINVFLTAPESQSSLGSYDDWLYILITHEFVHVVHIDTVGGVPRLLNGLLGFGALGKTFAPNLVQPNFLIEGLATMLESKLSSQGRHRSALFDMLLRSAVMDGTFQKIDQAASGARVFPHGSSPYLYGLHLMQYISSQYGVDKLAELSHVYGSRLIGFGLNRALEDVLGIDYEQLWAEYRRHMERRFRGQIRQIRARGIRQGHRLTYSVAGSLNGGHVRYPVWSGDGESIYFYMDNGHRHPGIYRVDAQGATLQQGVGIGKEGLQRGVEKIFDVNDDTPVLFVPGTQTAVFDESGPVRRRYYFSDLHLWTGKGNRSSVRLTTGARAREPHLAPDSKTVVFVRNHTGYSGLSFLDVETKKIVDVEPFEPYQQVYSPKWSPDGRSIAFSMYQEGGYRNIVVYNTDTGEYRYITRSRHLDTQPCWSPDGRHLVYSSDRTGVFNLHVFDFQTEQTHQVSNVFGGAFEAAFSPDGRSLIYSGFTSAGYDLWRLDWQPETFLAALPEQTSLRESDDAVEEQMREKPSDSSRRYLSVRTMYPRSLIPSVLELQLGSSVAQTGFTYDVSDISGFHELIANARFYGTRPGGSVFYRYSRPMTNLSLSAGRAYTERSGFTRFSRDESTSPVEQSPYVVDGYAEKLTKIEVGATTAIPFPNRTLGRSLRMTYGYRWAKYDETGRGANRLDPNAPVGDLPETGNLSNLNVGVSYSGTRGFLFGYGSERGNRASIELVYRDPVLGADYRDWVGMFSFSQFVRMPWRGHHVLALRLTGGAAAGGLKRRSPFYVGGFSLSQDVIRSAVTRSAFSQGGVLRGYAPNTLGGQAFGVVNAEYRLPLVDIARGQQLLPVFFRQLVLVGFSDWGYAWTGPIDRKQILGSVGGSLVLLSQVGFAERLELHLQYARGLDPIDGLSSFRAVIARSF